MKRKTLLWIFLVLIILACTGCSTDNTVGNDQPDAVKPPPQVRVEAMPSATPAPPTPAPAAPTSEQPTLGPTTSQSQVDAWPTPDEDAIMSQIDAMMDEIDQKLRNEDFVLKP